MRYIVQAVPERKDYVEYLRRRLPSLEVHWDDNHAGSIPSMQAVCRMAGEDPFVRLEDDALLCQNFAVEAQRRIALSPHQVHKLTCNEGDDRRQISRGLHINRSLLQGGFEVQGLFTASVAVYFPPAMGAAFADFLDDFGQKRFDPEHALFFRTWHFFKKSRYSLYPQDTLLGYYLSIIRSPYVLWIPGLTDHRTGQSFFKSSAPIERKMVFRYDQEVPAALRITKTGIRSPQWD